MKLINYFLSILLFSSSSLLAFDQSEFLRWKKNLKIIAIENEISEITFDKVMRPCSVGV